MTLPSLRAASISAGVIAVGSGAAALIGDANTAAAAAPDAFRIMRLEIFPSRIVSFLCKHVPMTRPRFLHLSPKGRGRRRAQARRRVRGARTIYRAIAPPAPPPHPPTAPPRPPLP